MTTDTIHQVYQFIRDYIEQHQVAPTTREICAGAGIAPGSANYYVHQLAKMGLVSVQRHKQRSIRLLNPTDEPQPTVVAPVANSEPETEPEWEPEPRRFVARRILQTKFGKTKYQQTRVYHPDDISLEELERLANDPLDELFIPRPQYRIVDVRIYPVRQPKEV